MFRVTVAQLYYFYLCCIIDSQFSVKFVLLASNGVVVATENKRKSLLYETTVEKVQKITPNIGMVYSGKYEFDMVYYINNFIFIHNNI